MKRFFSFLWKWKVILVMTFSVLSVLSSFFPPKFFWGLYFLSYALPIALILNVLLLIVYFFIRSHFWLIMIGLVVTLFGFSNNVAFNKTPEDTTASYSLLSYNVRLFDFYNWLEGKAWDEWKERTDNGAVLDSIYETIELTNTDFLCFQEYFNQNIGDYSTEKRMRKMGYQYSHINYSIKKNGNEYGIATFSKYPIIKKEGKFFNQGNINNGLLITDVQANSDTFRIINVHLESFKLGKKDYLYLNQLTDSALVSVQTQPTKDLVKKIKVASAERSKQLEYLQDLIENSPYKILLCGDFNELPNSYLYRQLTNDLKDGFQEVGSGLGSTLTSRVPGLRIDYVFHSPSISAVKHEVIKVALSDHYPVIFKFKNLDLVEAKEIE